jgi:hypothetical protein
MEFDPQPSPSSSPAPGFAAMARVSRCGIALARDGRLQRQEAVMKSIIDFGSELLFDRSRVASPHVRLLVTAIGQELARGSPWVSVNKRVLAAFEIGPELLAAERLLPQQRHVA